MFARVTSHLFTLAAACSIALFTLPACGPAAQEPAGAAAAASPACVMTVPQAMSDDDVDVAVSHLLQRQPYSQRCWAWAGEPPGYDHGIGSMVWTELPPQPGSAGRRIAFAYEKN